MPITDWPAADRPREKLLARGAAILSDAELLAIFLRTGLPGKSAVGLAQDLLREFGSLRPLLFWLLLVRPDALLSLLSDTPDAEWFEHHPTTLRALRLTSGLVVLIFGFLTGLAVAFLAGTS